jgi:DNA-binding NarL/FixJ family response regulator
VAQALDFRPQVILLDLDTSDRTGLATIADLRAALPEASLIALSCWAPTVTGRQC